MPHRIPILKKGDLLSIVAPAKAITTSYIDSALTFWEKEGFEILVSKSCRGQSNYFSGSLQERLFDFQEALDSREIKGIICARGGYGSVQILDLLDWSKFLKSPKWIIGFSDITYFHHRIFNLGICSIHATMPLNYASNTEGSFSSLFSAVSAKEYSVVASGNSYNIPGSVKGRVIGGNLSIIYSLLGTDDQADYSNCILVIEDLSEPLYHIDRMFYALKKAGVLNDVVGLCVGGMTELGDSEIPFGQSVNEIIVGHLEEYNIPVGFGFPVGHIDNNQAIIIGADATLDVSSQESRLSFNSLT
jgi:muramoyltetrapeptide carboxypeptidase